MTRQANSDPAATHLRALAKISNDSSSFVVGHRRSNRSHLRDDFAPCGWSSSANRDSFQIVTRCAFPDHEVELRILGRSTDRRFSRCCQAIIARQPADRRLIFRGRHIGAVQHHVIHNGAPAILALPHMSKSTKSVTPQAHLGWRVVIDRRLGWNDLHCRGPRGSGADNSCAGQADCC